MQRDNEKLRAVNKNQMISMRAKGFFAMLSNSVMSDSVTPWTAARHASLSITNSQSLLKLMSTESLIRSNHFILYCPLLLLPSTFPSIRVFSKESALPNRWPDIGVSASVLPMNIQDWFPLGLTTVQGTLKSLLQHHSSKASVLQCSAFFMVQLLRHTWLLENPQLWLYIPLHYEVILLVSVDCDSHSSGFRNVLFIFSHS